MPPEPRDAAHLWDMLRTAKALAASVEGVGLEAYLEREDLRLTVVDHAVGSRAHVEQEVPA